MKHIKLNDFSDIRNTIGEYILDPTEKYVITLENEIEFQMATLSAFQVMGTPPALKNYHAWLYEYVFSSFPSSTINSVSPLPLHLLTHSVE